MDIARLVLDMNGREGMAIIMATGSPTNSEDDVNNNSNNAQGDS